MQLDLLKDEAVQDKADAKAAREAESLASLYATAEKSAPGKRGEALPAKNSEAEVAPKQREKERIKAIVRPPVKPAVVTANGTAAATEAAAAAPPGAGALLCLQI
jgi:hypothetical protein